jgi:mutator protein MutT
MSDRFTTRSAIFVIVRNEQGEMLLQRRAGTNYLDGYFDFPSGHVEDKESIRAAAARELVEETGVIVREEDLRLVHINQNFLDAPYVNFTFVADTWSGEPSIREPNKCDDMGFFAPNALPEKCTLNVRVNEQAGFADDVTYSLVTPDNYEKIMHEPYA